MNEKIKNQIEELRQKWSNPSLYPIIKTEIKTPCEGLLIPVVTTDIFIKTTLVSSATLTCVGNIKDINETIEKTIIEAFERALI